MAVDLGDLIESLKAAINVPGETLFPNAEDDHWIELLVNGFWTGRISGLFAEHRVIDGEIVPVVDGADDLGRDYQQLIVMWSAYTAVRNRFIALPTHRRRRAGPVETETDYSATVLAAVLKDLRSELDAIVTSIKVAGDWAPARVLDAFAVRESAAYGGGQFPVWIR